MTPTTRRTAARITGTGTTESTATGTRPSGAQGPRGVVLGPVGVPLRRRAVLVGALVVLALLALTTFALVSGSLYVPVNRVLAALTGSGTRLENLVVVDHRLSRTLAAILVGFALGCSGALTQSVTRNPIASPDILGVTSGAGFFAVLLVIQPELTSSVSDRAASQLLAPAAVLGGLVTAGLVLGLAWRSGFDGLRLVLVGVSFNAVALAGTSWLLTRTDLQQAQVATRWLTGSLAGARMSDVALLAPVVAVALLLCAVLSRDLGTLRLGRQVAPTLGTPPARTEALALVVAVVLASVATAVTGPIGFVAFVAPQVAMRAFATVGPPPLAGGLTGALIVLAADLTAARLPVELPVGVPTSVIGATYLLILLNHRRRSARV